MNSYKWLNTIVMASISILFSSNLFSQDSDNSNDSENGLALEEVMVTAMRREQSLQDVPVTINAFTGEELERMRFREVDDIAAMIPNVDVKTALGGQNSVITIRGVGLNDFSSNNTGSVGVYVDEVFLASVASLEFNTFDTERVEVLKGPQGTLYGRNATAGAINIISREPSQEKGGYANFGIGNYGLLEGEAAVTGPMSDSSAFRLSAKVSRQDESYFHSLITGDDFGDRTAYAVRGQFSFSGDDWDSNLKLQFSNDDGPGTPYKVFGAMTPESSVIAREVADFLEFPELAPLLATDPLVGLGGVGSFCDALFAGVIDPFGCATLTGYQDQNPDPRVSAANFAGGNSAEVDSHDMTLRFTKDLSDSTRLTSITGFRSLERVFGEDTDGESSTLLEYQHNTDVEQWSQEFRFNISTENTEWVVGVFASNDEVTVRNGLLSDEFFLTRMLISVDQDTDSFAGFVNFDHTISDKLSVSGGLRLTYEDKSYKGGTTDLNPWGVSLLLMDPNTFEFYPDPLPLSYTDTSFDETDLSGRIGLEYRTSDTTMIYGSISKGFKSGGVIGDITFSNEELTPFKPEEVYAFEAGIKSQPADNIRFNASVFYYDYKDVQTFVQGSLGPVMGNVDEADVVGADIEIQWRPAENLMIQAGIGLLDTELGTPYKGNKLPNAPELTFTAMANYEIPLENGSYLVIGGDLKFADDMERNAENDPVTRTDSYTVVNARVAWETSDNGWMVALWVKNLGDEDYAQQTYFLPTLGNIIQAYNAPRTYGISLTRNFD